MKKTTLQELIEDFEESHSTAGTEVERILYRVCIEKAKALLPKEREDLEEAYQTAKDSRYLREWSGKKYVEKTFE